jgi:pyruvate dehydrogenase E2 component (dihydrolipoamide acetyltransferase)
VTVDDVEAAAGSKPPAERAEPSPPAEKLPPALPSAELAATVLAATRRVDLTALTGTGLGGRITVADVLSAAPNTPPGLEVRPAPADRADEELPAVTFSPEEAEAEEVTFYQKAVIRRVVASKHVIPHFYLTKMVNADALLGLQQKEKQGSGATLTHFLMRACALALENHPEANRSYDRGRWIRWKVIHLGLAIQTDAGLVVGVLRDAGEKDLGWIVENTRALVERARQGKLRAPERTNPTFTISNLGAFDVESFSAIINPPSAMTLAVGSVVPAPVVKDGEIGIGRLMHLTLSVDHRVVDGVLAARFLGEVKALLEDPEKLR